MNDQTIKADAGKLRMSLVPTCIIWAIAKVRTWATENKYHDPDSWKRVEIDRYQDALERHWYKYRDDPKSVDEESGLNHLYHCATNIAFLIELEAKNEEGTCDNQRISDAISEGRG